MFCRLLFVLLYFFYWPIEKVQKDKKSLKIPKGYSVNRRRTDNTMANRKSTKEQTTIYKTYI